MSEAPELMHAVLDGEASPDQATELQRRMATDPAAQAEFAALQGMFAKLREVPQQTPPEGLVAAVMAAVDQRTTQSSRLDQLSSSPRVLGAAPRDLNARTSTTPRWTTRLQLILRSFDMSNNSTFGNRKVWIGGAIAAAAVVVVAQFGFDGKTDAKDVMGTVAPADRYRAPQAGAADIKIGTPSGTQSAGTAPAAQGDAANNAAANNAAANNAAANNAAANNAAANNAAANNAAANNAAANNAAANNAAANNAAANNAAANNAAANNAAANNAAANNAAANNAAAKNAAAQATATK